MVKKSKRQTRRLKDKLPDLQDSEEEIVEEKEEEASSVDSDMKIAATDVDGPDGDEI